MFEVITQANPQDCQTMEILKDAYQRVGKQKEALAMARKLADTYVELGQYSAAMLEYEGILQKEPDNAGSDCRRWGKWRTKLQKSGQLKPGAQRASAHSAALAAPPSHQSRFPARSSPMTATLMTTAATLRPEGRAASDWRPREQFNYQPRRTTATSRWPNFSSSTGW